MTRLRDYPGIEIITQNTQDRDSTKSVLLRWLNKNVKGGNFINKITSQFGEGGYGSDSPNCGMGYIFVRRSVRCFSHLPLI